MDILGINKKNYDEKLNEMALTVSSLKTQAHALSCFNLEFARTTGSTTRLNKFFDRLTPGMQASFKRYAAAVCCEESGEAKTSWLTMSKGKFVINTLMEERELFWKDKDDERKTVSIEVLAAKPSFLEFDPDKIKNIFDDAGVLKAIKALVNKASKDEANVNAQVLKALEQAEVSIGIATARASNSNTPVANDEPVAAAAA